jgi:ribose transport system ATP-binding protein
MFGDRGDYELDLGGQPFAPQGPADALAAGVVYAPADRRGEGLAEPHSIRENVALPHVGAWAGAGLLARAREAQAVDRAARAIGVRAPDWETPVGMLSGGNQQKVVFARWSLQAARVLVLDEPTQGVDVATKQELYRLIRDRAAAGAAVVVVSSDLVELIGLSDRIVVFADGRPVAEVAAAEASEASLLSLAVTGARRHGPDTAQGAARSFLGRYGPAVLLLALVALIAAVTAASTDYFLTPRNLGALAGQTAPLLFAALGQMAVILLGGIDLTVGPVISLVTTIASYLLAPDAPVPVAVGVAACLGAGLAVGLLNAAVIVLFRIPDLVATLGTFSVVQGIALILRPAPGGSIDPEVAAAITERIGRLPLAFLAAVAVFLVAEALLVRGRLGARLYTLGGSAEAAAVAGIDGARLRALVYLFSGLMAAVAGLMIAARIGSGDPQAGATFTLASVTAVVVGGTPVFGGMGTAAGTFLGAVLVVLIQNVLNQFQVTAYWQYVWTGLLTIAAVVGYGLRSPAERRAMAERARRVIHRVRAEEGGKP